MRTGRTALEQVTDAIPGYHFTLGKGSLLKDGKDVTIIATGLMVQEALKAAVFLEKVGIHPRIIDMHTIKPIDTEIILKAAHETRVIVTAEEHSIIGGLGAAVCEVICEARPVPVIRVGVNDEFGRSGEPNELLKYYGLSQENLIQKVLTAIGKK
jgi:transketolase